MRASEFSLGSFNKILLVLFTFNNKNIFEPKKSLLILSFFFITLNMNKYGNLARIFLRDYKPQSTYYTTHNPSSVTGRCSK